MQQINYESALVSGASRGIGEAICRRLRAEGLTVHAIARSHDRLHQLQDEIGVHPHVVDISDREQIAKLAKSIEADVLVNCAGYIPELGSLEKLRSDSIDRMIDVNLRGPLHLIKGMLPFMLKIGRGHIINIGSTTGNYVFGGTVPYASAKAGMSAASRVMRYDLNGTGIRVTEISPGRVETGIYTEALASEPGVLKEMYDKVKALERDDIADAVIYVLKVPEAVDVSFLEIVPTDQAPGGYKFAERG